MSGVIFVDFDGCMVTPGYQRKRRPGDPRLDPACVRVLARACHEYNLAVVISSAWRSTIADMKILLARAGFKDARDYVIGVTPFLPEKSRGGEIAAYLAKNPHWPAVIVDDEDDMGNLLTYLVQTNWRTGLVEADIERIAAVLEKQK